MDQILQVLSGNARMDLDKMAVMLDMPAEEIQKKIQEYEQAGVIRGYKPLLDYDKIDTELVEAIIEVRVSPQRDFGFEEMQQAQKSLHAKYEEKWGPLSPRVGRDHLLWMMAEAGEVADVVKKRGDDITFLRRIVRGPADDSYGIEVAKLAGLPECVTQRAKEVLAMLVATAPEADRVRQLGFEEFAPPAKDEPASPGQAGAIAKLRDLDVETLTPLEALNVLYQLKQALDEAPRQ